METRKPEPTISIERRANESLERLDGVSFFYFFVHHVTQVQLEKPREVNEARYADPFVLDLPLLFFRVEWTRPSPELGSGCECSLVHSFRRLFVGIIGSIGSTESGNVGSIDGWEVFCSSPRQTRNAHPAQLGDKQGSVNDASIRP